jgi:hypothetical protein
VGVQNIDDLALSSAEVVMRLPGHKWISSRVAACAVVSDFGRINIPLRSDMPIRRGARAKGAMKIAQREKISTLPEMAPENRRRGMLWGDSGANSRTGA